MAHDVQQTGNFDSHCAAICPHAFSYHLYPREGKGKTKDYTLWRQLNEKPGIIPGCSEI